MQTLEASIIQPTIFLPVSKPAQPRPTYPDPITNYNACNAF